MKDSNAAQFGQFCALQAAIRALVMIHPDQDRLVASMKTEAEETLSLLLGKQVPDVTIEAFRDAWNGLAISRDAGPYAQDSRL